VPKAGLGYPRAPGRVRVAPGPLAGLG